MSDVRMMAKVAAGGAVFGAIFGAVVGHVAGGDMVAAAATSSVLFGVLVPLGESPDEEAGSDDALETVAGAQMAYVRGDIDEAELERRLDVLVDGRNETLRKAVETIPNVGTHTSRSLAAEFDSLDELRDADRERIESVIGVGEQTADELETL